MSATSKPFALLSEASLADQLGDADTLFKEVRKHLEALRKEMTRRGAVSIDGTRYIVVKAVETAMRFDSAAVKDEMGLDWYEERRAPVESTTFTAIRKPEAGGGGPATEVAAPSPELIAAEALFKAPQ